LFAIQTNIHYFWDRKSRVTQMNAVKDRHFAVEASRPEEARAPALPLRARPVKHPRSYQEMLEDGKKSFPKIIAYLAR
jgi:hypothetical protein